MSLVQQAGRLRGPFRGFNNKKNRFTFADGAVWRQNEAKYVYFYAANPRARVIYENGVYLLEVDGTEEVVEVVSEQ